MKFAQVVDNPFNRIWYPDLIGRYYELKDCPSYAIVRIVEPTVHDHPNWSHEMAYGPCTKPVIPFP